jgi:hypothetical protein
VPIIVGSLTLATLTKNNECMDCYLFIQNSLFNLNIFTHTCESLNLIKIYYEDNDQLFDALSEFL